MKNTLAALALCALAPAAFAGEDLAFVVLGDWGWNGYKNQKLVADKMAEEAEAIDISFIVSTGDNFQVNGVRSVQDPLWNRSFENVYTHPVLEKDWYPVLGNHDYRGSTQAQIDYSKISRRWNLPARYYSIKQSVSDHADLEMFFLDTSPFQTRYHGKKKAGAYPDVPSQDTTAQLRWVDSALTASKAKWKLVFGHHPLHSGGEKHGQETGDMRRLFSERFEKLGVTAYFCGHDHHMEHVAPKGSAVQYFVNGAHSLRNATPGPDTRFCKVTAGFTTVQVREDSLIVRFLDTHRKVLHRAALAPRLETASRTVAVPLAK